MDFVIVGGGIAGLRAAIGLASAGRVVVLAKSDPTESNTGYAQGGIAAAIGDDDSPQLHASDTMRAGDGLCDAEAVRVLVENGPAYVRERAARRGASPSSTPASPAVRCAPPRRCWQRAAPAGFFARRPTPRLRPATALRSRTSQARAWRTWNSSSLIRPR